MYRTALLLFALLALDACAPSKAAPVAGPNPALLTFCVVDESASYGQVTTRAGGVTIRTNSGERACKPLFGETGRVAVDVESIGGGMRGPLRWQDSFNLNVGVRCYLLVVKNLPEAMGVVPCDFYRGRDADAATEGQDGNLTKVMVHPRWNGLTFCPDGGERASAWANLSGLTNRDWAPTIAHELAHVGTIERDGGCTAHKALRVADPRGTALRVESEGFCASSRVWARQEGVSLAEAIWRYAGWLTSYGFGLTQAQAADEISRRCA
jgi:hypothetical protein